MPPPPGARAPWSGRRRASPRPPGCRPAPRSARGRPPDRARPRVPVSPCRWKGSKIRARSAGATPGPWSTTRSSTRCPPCSTSSTVTASLCRRALATRLATHPLQQAGVDVRRRQRRRPPPAPRPRAPASARRTTSSSGTSAAIGWTAPVCEPAHVEQVADHRGQPGDGAPSPRAAPSARSSSSRVVVHAQRLGGRAEPGQRRAQVVGDGGEQRRTRAVAGLELLGGHALPGQLLALAQHADVGGERGDDRRSRASERGAAQHQPAAGSGRERRPSRRGRLRLLGRPARRTRPRRCRGPGRAAAGRRTPRRAPGG